MVVPVPLPDCLFISTYNPGEIKSCISLNGVGDAIIENIHFNDVHIITKQGRWRHHAEEAASSRQFPQNRR